MQYDPPLPPTASLLWALIAFFIFLIVLHIVFLKLWKLTRTDWKYVDYVWLSFAALGLVAGTAEVRRFAAANRLPSERVFVLDTYESYRNEVRFMTGLAVCRQFVRSEYSPKNLARIQDEYNQACFFARNLYTQLPADPPPDLASTQLRDRPALNDEVLVSLFANLDRSADNYVRAKRAFESLVASTDRTPGEKQLATLFPFLLAIALALRISKVTGEILLET